MSNNGYGFVDTRGYVLIKPIFSLIETDTIGKYFYVEQKDRVNKTKTVGYINREENWIYKQIKPMVYDSLRRYWK
jgi:hypothetical protein